MILNDLTGRTSNGFGGLVQEGLDVFPAEKPIAVGGVDPNGNLALLGPCPQRVLGYPKFFSGLSGL